MFILIILHCTKASESSYAREAFKITSGSSIKLVPSVAKWFRDLFLFFSELKIQFTFYLRTMDGPEATISPSSEDLYEEVDEDFGSIRLEPSRRHRPDSDYIYEVDTVLALN